jgi:Domain of unknown function (DUF4377)
MFHKLLAGLVLIALTACSEPPATEPPLATQQPDESGLYPPVVTTPDLATLTLWVAAEKRECMAVGPTECLQIRLHPNEDWQLFYGEILGFDYQPGKIYQIEVSEVQLAEPPMDAPDRQWVLRQIISSHAE